MKSKTAMSTRLSMEVMITGCRFGGCRLVLVGVDPDSELARGGSGLEDTGAGAAGGVEDDVGACVVQALPRGSPLGRVGEAGEVRRLGEVLDLHLRSSGFAALAPAM